MLKKLDNKYVTIFFVAMLSVLWGIVLLYGGTIGPYAWWGLMAFGIIGIFAFMICVINILIKILKRCSINKRIFVLLILTVFSAWPSGWFCGIGQIPYPANENSVKPSVYIRSPFNKPVITAWGGNTLRDNYHVWLPFERWAYDLFAAPALVESQNLEDYGIYGAEIVAPISGTVVGAYGDEEDIGTGLDEFKSTLGNYIFIRIEESGTYLVLSHLKHNSVKVKAGDYVKEGMPIAQAGNSGSTSEPHLHIHHQRQDPNKALLLAEGLPLYFRNIDGAYMPKGGGDRFENGIRIPNGDMIYPFCAS